MLAAISQSINQSLSHPTIPSHPISPPTNHSKMSPPTSKFFTIIAGVGPGTGRATALHFATHYPTILLARHPSSYEPILSEITSTIGRVAHGISTDVADPASVADAFEKIRRHKDFGGAGRKLAAVVYNVGGGFVRKPFLELSLGEFEAGWESNR